MNGRVSRHYRVKKKTKKEIKKRNKKQIAKENKLECTVDGAPSQISTLFANVARRTDLLSTPLL